MCTSFTYQIKNGSNALARSMDFAFKLDPDIVLIPRGFSWQAQPDRAVRTTTYAFTGLGRHLGEYVFADGVNEQGLCCAVLYFSGYASYQKEPLENKINLAPHEVVFWLLSSCSTVGQVREAVKDLNITASVIDLLGLVPPFHWIVTDRLGDTIVIEPLEDGLSVCDNPVGVMSNSPDFSWHMTNIRNYIGVRPYQLKPVTLGGVTFAPFGQGSGTMGIPGDYTPPSRFLRALFGKETINRAENELDAVTAIFHILSSVDIPKGSVVTDKGIDYTQHSCCMFCDSGAYYFKTYDNSQIIKVDLFAEDLNAPAAKTWPVPKTQQINAVNARP